MKSLSPCARPECIKKNKLKCCETCPELMEYQRFLLLTEDRYSPPGIDYSDENRMSINTSNYNEIL